MSLNIHVIKDKILSENWFVLRNMTYELTRADGSVVRHKREVYDRGNGATVLLYNRHKQTVVLVRQFRVATWVNGNHDGMLIETCAGLLDNDEPEACIRKEAVEETGYEVGEVRKLFELFMSPGGVTEVVHFFIAEYSDAQRTTSGGGVDDEAIEVLELPFSQALQMVDMAHQMLLAHLHLHLEAAIGLLRLMPGQGPPGDQRQQQTQHRRRDGERVRRGVGDPVVAAEPVEHLARAQRGEGLLDQRAQFGTIGHSPAVRAEARVLGQRGLGWLATRQGHAGILIGHDGTVTTVKALPLGGGPAAP